MENIEQIFKKVNKDRIFLNDHKEKLRSVLMDSRHFEEKESGWDLKLTVSSLAFSSLLILFSYVYPATHASQTAITSSNQDAGFYNSLLSSKNVSPSTGEWNNQEVKIIQTVEENSRAVYYFNNRNVLVNSQVINNK